MKIKRSNPMIGRRFGQWIVLRLAQKRWPWDTYTCVCDCGTIRDVRAQKLHNGSSGSCGCRRIIHGEARRHQKMSREYMAWRNAKNRCSDLNNPYYGGRGIRMCKRWLNSFLNFLIDMGRCPDGMWLERIDNDGNYEPGNCKWATPTEQAHNKMRER